MDKQKDALQIKGLRDGLLIALGPGEWKDLQSALLQQIEARQPFFRGARVALDVGSQTLRVNELSALRDRLSEQGITLWAVVSESATTEKTAQLLGLATRISKPRPQEAQTHTPKTTDTEAALFIGRTLRSGMRIEFPGHVFVFGDVNPGAEIVAEGNVFVWGRVRGMIHAGSKGNTQAVIGALDLSPIQLRIADQVSAMLRPQQNPRPELASLSEEGKLQAVPWQPT